MPRTFIFGRPMYLKIKTNHHKTTNIILFYFEFVFVFKILSEAKN